jgi:hypothetical protein
MHLFFDYWDDMIRDICPPYNPFTLNKRMDGRRGEPGRHNAFHDGKYTKKYADNRQKRKKR